MKADACHSQCGLQAIGSIGNDKINIRKIWNKLKDSNRVWMSIKEGKEKNDIEEKFLKALEADCSSIKSTKRCEVGEKFEACFLNTYGRVFGPTN